MIIAPFLFMRFIYILLFFSTLLLNSCSTSPEKKNEKEVLLLRTNDQIRAEELLRGSLKDKGLQLLRVTNFGVTDSFLARDSAAVLEKELYRLRKEKITLLNKTIQMDRDRIKYYEDNFESKRLIRNATKKYRVYIVELQSAINELRTDDFTRYKPLDALAKQLAKLKSDSLRVMYKDLNLHYESVDTIGVKRVHQSMMRIYPHTMWLLLKTNQCSESTGTFSLNFQNAQCGLFFPTCQLK